MLWLYLKFSSTNILRNCLAIILLKFSYCICIKAYLTRSLFNNKPWWYSSYIVYARFFMFNNLWHNWFQKENHTNQLNPASNIKSCGLQNGSSLLLHITFFKGLKIMDSDYCQGSFAVTVIENTGYTVANHDSILCNSCEFS